MKRRRLGQHYLTDPEAVRRFIAAAKVGPSERVLEIGTGKGVLTKELARLGSSLEWFEVDRENFAATSKAMEGLRTVGHLSDAFDAEPRFDVLVASLPYSRSAAFVEWLGGLDYDRAVVLLQKDFVQKVITPPGSRDYRAVSVLAQLSSEVEVLGSVLRRSFSPPPRVDSQLVRFRPRVRLEAEEVTAIKRLFSLRRREVRSALAELGMEGHARERRRVYSLTPPEVHELCSPRGSA